MEFFVKAFSDEGDLVFDPFLGSATSMAAAHVLSRVGYGCEISPAYCDVAMRRKFAIYGRLQGWAGVRGAGIAISPEVCLPVHWPTCGRPLFC